MTLSFIQYLTLNFFFLALLKVTFQNQRARLLRFPLIVCYLAACISDLGLTAVQETNFKFLGISRTFSKEDLTQNRKKLFEKHHPDSGGEDFMRLNDLLEIYGKPNINSIIIRMHDYFNDDVIKLFYDRSSNKDFKERTNEQGINSIIEYIISYFSLSLVLKGLSSRLKIIKWILPIFLAAAFLLENNFYSYYNLGLPTLSLSAFSYTNKMSIYLQTLLIKKIILSVFFLICLYRLMTSQPEKSVDELSQQLLSGEYSAQTLNSLEAKLTKKIRKHLKIKKNVNLYLLITVGYFALQIYNMF